MYFEKARGLYLDVVVDPSGISLLSGMGSGLVCLGQRWREARAVNVVRRLSGKPGGKYKALT